jgi:hypothetical protein
MKSSLMPFLYQTRTIQQHAASGRRWPQSEQPNPKTTSDHVPFEHTKDLKELDDTSDVETTITNTEKAVFERLFTNIPIEGKTPKSTRDIKSEADTITKTKPAASMSAMPTSTDHAPRIDPTAFPVPLQRMAATAAQKLQTQQEEAFRKQENDIMTTAWQRAKAGQEKRRQADPLEKEIMVERERVLSRIAKAKTDVELWQVLEGEVFSKIEALDLDDTRSNTKVELQAAKARVDVQIFNARVKLKAARKAAKKSEKEAVNTVEILETTDRTALENAEVRIQAPVVQKRRTRKATPEERVARAEAKLAEYEEKMNDIRSMKIEPQQQEPKNAELSLIGPNYSIFLTTAIVTLRTNFPTSTLPFTILPRLKSLGRGSYALGASTPLYNELIKAVWHSYTDFRFIDELLQEMDNGGLEFDQNTLDILEEIRLEGNRIKNGRYGINRRAVWSTDIIQNGWRKVILWIPNVRDRVERDIVRRAKEMAQDQQEVEERHANVPHRQETESNIWTRESAAPTHAN